MSGHTEHLAVTSLVSSVEARSDAGRQFAEVGKRRTCEHR
jgi:hypothetical protein